MPSRCSPVDTLTASPRASDRPPALSRSSRNERANPDPLPPRALLSMIRFCLLLEGDSSTSPPTTPSAPSSPNPASRPTATSVLSTGPRSHSRSSRPPLQPAAGILQSPTHSAPDVDASYDSEAILDTRQSGATGRFYRPGGSVMSTRMTTRDDMIYTSAGSEADSESSAPLRHYMRPQVGRQFVQNTQASPAANDCNLSSYLSTFRGVLLMF